MILGLKRVLRTPIITAAQAIDGMQTHTEMVTCLNTQKNQDMIPAVEIGTSVNIDEHIPYSLIFTPMQIMNLVSPIASPFGNQFKTLIYMMKRIK